MTEMPYDETNDALCPVCHKAQHRYMADQPCPGERAETADPLPPWGFRPYVHLATTGPNGNIYDMLRECRRQAKAARKTPAQIEAFTSAVVHSMTKPGNTRNDAIRTIETWLTVTWIDAP